MDDPPNNPSPCGGTRRRFVAAALSALAASACERAAVGSAMRTIPPTPTTAPTTPARTTTAPSGGAPTGLLFDPLFRAHNPGPTHPESPARLDAIRRGLEQANLWSTLTPITPSGGAPAAEADLLLCHDRAYLQQAQREIESGQPALSTGDTAVCRASWKVALSAAGGVLRAVDAVLAGKLRTAFCAVRPPGHHAGPACGRGFCILNNVALAARYAQKRHGIGKVLIVDWDVHHGNGTQEIFDADPSVLFFDTHQSPWYPHSGAEGDTGQGPARGTKINVPLPAGAGRKEILAAYESKLLPAAQRFKPDLVFISAGFDSRQGDPLGKFTLTDEDFAALTRFVLHLARATAAGRLISVLEGGYNLDGLSSAVAAHVGALQVAG